MGQREVFLGFGGTDPRDTCSGVATPRPEGFCLVCSLCLLGLTMLKSLGVGGRQSWQQVLPPPPAF